MAIMRTGPSEKCRQDRKDYLLGWQDGAGGEPQSRLVTGDAYLDGWAKGRLALMLAQESA